MSQLQEFFICFILAAFFVTVNSEKFIRLTIKFIVAVALLFALLFLSLVTIMKQMWREARS